MPSDEWMALRERLPTTAAVLADGLERRIHSGVQVYVSVEGRAVADAAMGEARPNVPMTPGHLTLWMSAGKPLTAYLAATLVGEGKLDLDAAVADFIPGFDAGGKGAVTVRHLLTHTGGFRQVSSNWSPEPWSRVIERVAHAELEADWTPGEAAGYHVASGWYALAEVCRVAAGAEATDADVSGLIRSRVIEPLKMQDAWIGMPRHRYIDYGTQSATTCDTSKGEATPLAFPNSEKGHVLCRPGGNARGPARALGRFYEQLLIDRGDLEGEAILPRETARTFTTRARSGLRDRTFGAEIDWCLGFLAADAEGRRIPYGYGPHASSETFGHSGNQSSCAFADPVRKLVACWVTTGLPGEMAHQKRQQAVNAAIYEDLGLA